jgi:hypothetical protein
MELRSLLRAPGQATSQDPERRPRAGVIQMIRGPWAVPYRTTLTGPQRLTR